MAADTVGAIALVLFALGLVVGAVCGLITWSEVKDL